MRVFRRKKSNSQGFTLIELLIVIIIIGILAAIAFVAYSGATNKANKSAAQSTISEAQSKLAEYNGDNGNYPTTMTTFQTWLTSSTGGNNTQLSSSLGSSEYTYTASPTSCDDNVTPCTGYTVSASSTFYGGGANVSGTN